VLRHRLFRPSAGCCGFGSLCRRIHRRRTITFRRSGSRRLLRCSLINALSRRKSGRCQQGRNGHRNHQCLSHLIFQFKLNLCRRRSAIEWNGPNSLSFRFYLRLGDVLGIMRVKSRRSMVAYGSISGEIGSGTSALKRRPSCGCRNQMLRISAGKTGDGGPARQGRTTFGPYAQGVTPAGMMLLRSVSGMLRRDPSQIRPTICPALYADRLH
jgi:hypothetical protein